MSWNFDSEEKRVSLASGGAISYCDLGDTESRIAILYFHGFPGSRIEGLALNDAAKHHGLRVIACDRPGMGGSDFSPRHSIAAWGHTCGELADRLKIDKFSVIGVSGGGPYATSVATALGERVKKLCLVSSMAPTDAPGILDGMTTTNRWLLSQAGKRSWLVKPMVASMAKCWLKSPGGAIIYLKKILPKRDGELLSRPEFHKFFRTNIKEAFRAGVGGPIHEFWQLAKPWNIDFSSIKASTTLWHGNSDSYVPPAMCKYLSSVIPNSNYRLVDDGGHFVAFNLIEDVLAECRGG